MRIASVLAVLLLAVTPASPQSLVISDVNVIDVTDGSVHPGMTVVVEGDTITAVDELGVRGFSPRASVIDASGKYLIPGLWDMHVHMVNDVDKPVPWDFHVPAPDAVDQREIYMPVYLAFGITGAREMSGGHASLEIRDRIRTGDLLGPRLVVGSPLLDGPQPFSPDASVISISSSERAREVATELDAEGFDFLKPYSLLPDALYRTLLETSMEVGIEVAGEVPIAVSLWDAADLGQRSVEHLTGVDLACSTREDELRQHFRERLNSLIADPTAEDRFDIWYESEWVPIASVDAARCRKLFYHLAEQGVWVVPTLVVQRANVLFDDPAVSNDPNLKYAPRWARDFRAMAADWDPDQRLSQVYHNRTSMIVELRAAGVGILAGTDMPAGFTLHDELEILVNAGLSPLDALRTATINPARYLRRTSEFGRIEPGMRADMVLLNSNPLEDIRNTRKIEAVVFRGHVLDRTRIEEMLRQAAAEEADPLH